eukprot:GSMAST32.ASY1.ANO1.2071.1 assembled CDS
MDAEDALFYLYTSGSTGAPKATTHKFVFDLRENDVFACVADCGWITGHSYIIYGPLCNGATTVMFESTPLYPDAGRYWDLVATHKVTQFYTAPTAIRALIGKGDEWPSKYDLTSLRVLGTVAWVWYYEKIGNKNCAIVDTYWQTETGCTPTKPGEVLKGNNVSVFGDHQRYLNVYMYVFIIELKNILYQILYLTNFECKINFT